MSGPTEKGRDEICCPVVASYTDQSKPYQNLFGPMPKDNNRSRPIKTALAKSLCIASQLDMMMRSPEISATQCDLMFSYFAFVGHGVLCKIVLLFDPSMGTFHIV